MHHCCYQYRYQAATDAAIAQRLGRRPEVFFVTAAQAHPMPKQYRENTVKDMNGETSEST